MILLTIALLATCTPTALLDFAMQGWKADDAVRIEDAYKWTYQATRGGEHAVPDKDSARKWLDDEWQSLSASKPKESLWEPLCPGNEIGRLNLRPFRAQGGKLDDLLGAFLMSSREYRADETIFVAAWMELGQRLEKNSAGRLNYKAWRKLDAKMKAKSYPAIHHSKSYKAAKQPAYRILTKEEMQKIVRN